MILLKNNAIKILLCFVILLIGSCTITEQDPVSSSDFTFSKENTNALNINDLTGIIISRSATNMVPINKDSAVVVITFLRKMNSASIAATLTQVDTRAEESLTQTWDINDNASTLTIKPDQNLTSNKRYCFEITASSVKDIYGNMLDSDGDNIGGENPDDNVKFYFTTYADPSTAGTADAILIADTVGPNITGTGVFAYDANNDQIRNSNDIRVDDNFYLRIRDQILNTDSTSNDSVIAYSGTIDNNVVKLIKSDDKSNVECNVSVVNDPDTSVDYDNSTIKINPSSNLDPSTQYTIVVAANMITDAAGNKMDSDNSNGDGTIAYNITTSSKLVSGEEVRDDVTAPSVTSSNYSSTDNVLTVKFSELVDESTLTSSNIWYKQDNIVYNFKISIVTDYSGTDQITVLYLTPSPAYSQSQNSAELNILMKNIEDMNGNLGTSNYTDNF